MPATRKKLRVLQLAAIIFLTVSGGPYGLEPLLGYAGRNGALLLLFVTPLLWDIPTIFTVLELNGMMPVNGGYYEWVKRALGLRFGFYEGWWTWLYTFVDLAIYPVLFVTYASFFFPDIAHYKIPVCLTIIWLGAGLNILGVAPVGKASMLLGALVLAPFAVLFVVAFMHHTPFVFPTPSLKGIPYPSLGMALYTVMWNFFGWDNATTYADDVASPVRTYARATGIAFVSVFAVYFIVMLVVEQTGINAAVLADKGFPELGRLVGGYWMAAAISIGGMASALGLFSAVLLSVSRVPEVMAADGLLPRKLNKLHPKFGTPYVSVIICALVVSFMIAWTFSELIILDVTLYGAGLFLEFISLIVLRIRFPQEHRPYKIPLPVAGLCVLFLLPVAVYCIALSGAFLASPQTLKPALFAAGALLSAELVWQLIRLRQKRKMTLR